MRKKRKYTRRKKNTKLVYLKKITLYSALFLILHILFINTVIIFGSLNISDTLVILWNNKQNSQKISENNKIILNKSIKLFKDEYAKKILILWEKNNFWINETKIISEYLMKNEIWWGSIATEISDNSKYWKNISLFLKNNDWESIILVQKFSDISKMKYILSQNINTKNISISPVYIGVFDSVFWIFTNYYYFWKI